MRLLIIPFLLIIASCAQPTDNSALENSLIKKENELLKRELLIRDQELEVARQKDIPISELYKQVKQGVFIIYTQGFDNESQGTGFFLNSLGIAITNYHVFENAEKAVIILDNGEKCLIDKIIDYDKEKDYVIFKVNSQSNSYHALHVSNGLPEIGATCFAIGNPKGLTQTLSIGNISGYRDEDNLIQTTTEITHGSSGGPLFNASGEVVGVTSSGFGEANLNFAINIQSIPYGDFMGNISIPSTTPSLSQSQRLPNSSVSQDEVLPLIRDYFDALLNQQYDKVYECYSPRLDRFYSRFNISSSDAIKEDVDYKMRNGIIPKEIRIDWNNIEISKVGDDYNVSLRIDYRIERSNPDKPTRFNLAIFMTVSSQMKITSIYENIILHS